MNRAEFEQEWNFEPAQRLPNDAPKPWMVAGYSFKSVDSVLRVDYLAQRVRHPRSVYEVLGGQITYIGHPEELRGMPHGKGTLFILWPPGHDSATLMRIIDEAKVRVAEVRDLAAGASK